MKLNPILAIDGYKVSHRVQYPQGTTNVYSNFTPRSDRFSSRRRPMASWCFRPAGLSAVVLVDLFNEAFSPARKRRS